MTFGILLLAGTASGFVAAAETSCASNPAAAVRAFEHGAAADGAGDGYRVTGVRRDPVLQITWASVGRCGHPEWPEVSVATTARLQAVAVAALAEGSGARMPARPQNVAIAQARSIERVVKPGDVVRLWHNETNVRMELTAVCDESGALGDKVRVHVTSRLEDGTVVRYISGLVRGPADVEME